MAQDRPDLVLSVPTPEDARALPLAQLLDRLLQEIQLLHHTGEAIALESRPGRTLALLILPQDFTELAYLRRRYQEESSFLARLKEVQSGEVELLAKIATKYREIGEMLGVTR